VGQVESPIFHDIDAFEFLKKRRRDDFFHRAF